MDYTFDYIIIDFLFRAAARVYAVDAENYDNLLHVVSSEKKADIKQQNMDEARGRKKNVEKGF